MEYKHWEYFFLCLEIDTIYKKIVYIWRTWNILNFPNLSFLFSNWKCFCILWSWTPFLKIVVKWIDCIWICIENTFKLFSKTLSSSIFIIIKCRSMWILCRSWRQIFLLLQSLSCPKTTLSIDKSFLFSYFIVSWTWN